MSEARCAERGLRSGPRGGTLAQDGPGLPARDLCKPGRGTPYVGSPRLSEITAGPPSCNGFAKVPGGQSLRCHQIPFKTMKQAVMVLIP